MIAYPHIDPVAFHIFSWPVYWYGLMYLVGFLGGWGLLFLKLRYGRANLVYPLTYEELADVVFYTALGAIIGGRLGYMLFYNSAALIQDPLLIFQTWKGGMSFHGGFLGAITAMYLFSRHIKQPFLAITDFIAPAIPIGLGAGRIGNFINGELWGRVTNVPWAMVFPHADQEPRHPSQLYEFGLEGILLFIILLWFSWRQKPLGAVSGMFALCYGLLRIFVECFREPDIQIGYLLGGVTEGQLLSLPLVFVGIIILIVAYRKVWERS